MKKRMYVLILLVLILTVSLSNDIYGLSNNMDIKVWIKDYYIMSDQKPFIKYERSYVPVRFILEELGYKVIWNGEDQTIKIKDDLVELKLKVNSKKALVNKKEKDMEVPVILVENTTFVPLRLVTELLNKNIDYNENYNIAVIGEGYNQAKPIIQE